MRAPDSHPGHSDTTQQCVHHGEESITRTVTIGGEKYSSTIDTSFVEKNPTEAEPDFPEELLALPEWWWAVLHDEKPETAKERRTREAGEARQRREATKPGK